MKPLDLNVGIQNSYEAARSEAVRLDKPQVLNQLQNQDSAKEQLARDQRVSPPENAMLHQNLFSEDAYDPPEYNLSDSEKRKKQQQPGQKKSEAAAAVETKDETVVKTEEETGGFSTYA